MNVEELFNSIDAKIFAYNGRHLNNVERLLIEAALSEKRQTYDQIAQTSNYSANYLKLDAGPKLWKQLSEFFGEEIKKTNFRTTMERLAGLASHEGGVIYQNQICNTDRCQDWGTVCSGRYWLL